MTPAAVLQGTDKQAWHQCFITTVRITVRDSQKIVKYFSKIGVELWLIFKHLCLQKKHSYLLLKYFSLQCSPAFIRQNMAMWHLWVILCFVFLFETIFVTIWKYLSNSHCNWTRTAGLRQSSIINAYLQNQFTSGPTSQWNTVEVDNFLIAIIGCRCWIGRRLPWVCEFLLFLALTAIKHLNHEEKNWSHNLELYLCLKQKQQKSEVEVWKDIESRIIFLV